MEFYLKTNGLEMKVLQVGKFYDPYPGGMETVLRNICQGLRFRVDVRVLVANTCASTVHENKDFPITRAASLGTVFSTSICPSFPFWLKKFSADILHVHIPNPLAELSYFLSGRNTEMVAHFHSDIVRQKSLLLIYKPFLNRFYKRAVRIIVPTPNHINCSPFLPLHREKCRIVPFGISSRDFDLNHEEKKKVDHLKEEVPTLLFVGRLVYYKGLDILIHAMADIQAKLWIIGNGPLETELKKLVLKLNLEKKVRFLGTVKQRDLVYRYHACDMLVLPSVANSEMFGMVQLEAMACRKPVIATKLPTGVSWVNQDGITGILVPPKDVSALARAIQRLIQNPSLCKEMGQAGRKRVEEIFTIEKMVDGIMEVYKEVLSS
jgi:glycosyltransferase involved in cell wall biosynthesis